jgi:hypothetical protein
MSHMKVFISSVIAGYEHFRAGAAEAVETLGHTLLRSEDFPASPGTAQQACLAAVRESDVVVLLLGARYGTPQESGLSATHEEYREARDGKPLLVFIEAGITPEPSQKAFIEEVQAWATGNVTANFSTQDELTSRLIRALHNHELATSSGAVDESEMLERAKALLPERHGMATSAHLVLAITGGPYQQVLRPAQLEDPELARDLQREALFGNQSVLDASEGTDVSIEDATLVLRQRERFVSVDQAGSICVGQPATRATGRGAMELTALIEEDLAEALARALRFSGWLLDRIDPVHRLSDVVIVVHLSGAGYMPWRTRAEHAASPNSGQVGLGAHDITVGLTPARRRRQALTHDVDRIAEDLVVLLRRERTR